MTQRPWMLGMMAGLLAVAVVGCGQEKVLPLTGGVSFNSRVAFEVYANKTGDMELVLIGQTPSEKPIQIPPCLCWWVAPIAPVDMQQVRKEIQAKGIPGIAVFTDKDLEHLEGLKRLQVLFLGGTKVTDAGLAHLEGLTGLQYLDLFGTKVTDAGLAHLEGLKGLQMLDIGGFDETQVTDAGLAHLEGLTGLQDLNLVGTEVTDAGIAKLRKALPHTHISCGE